MNKSNQPLRSYELVKINKQLKFDKMKNTELNNGNHTENLILNILNTYEEYERKILSERIKLGMKKHVENGGKLGRKISKY